MSIEKLGRYFVAIEDPRCSGKGAAISAAPVTTLAADPFAPVEATVTAPPKGA